MFIYRRHPEWLANVAKSDDETDKESRKKRSIKKSNVKHHIILIRHGQYNTKGKTDSDRTLTTLGWYQIIYYNFKYIKLL